MHVQVDLQNNSFSETVWYRTSRFGAHTLTIVDITWLHVESYTEI